jgi:murein DD-endopeptidase MepM/ murein hydrolase activator NlpD
MVEIDHGNGLSTRYGHLSAISVSVGQSIKIGQVVGEVGSTGRSTGPHLHYETRIDGEAVDPQKFLRAGIRLNDG